MKVAAFFLGGTISYRAGDHDQVDRLDPEALTAELAVGQVRLETHSYDAGPSASVQPDLILDLVRRARSSTADGFVVVQGTDTIEETAFLADLVWDDPRPLVFTGAMRTAGALSADGAANLSAAIKVAADELFADQGVLVVTNDQVHAARHVRKTHTTSVASLASPAAGPLGFLHEGRTHRTWTVPARSVHAPKSALGARVPVFAPGLGEGPEALTAMAEVADGLVALGMGGGHLPAACVPALTTIAARIPVVLAARGHGHTLQSTYRSPGSEGDLLPRGLISAGYLSVWQSRLLLMVGLACDYDRARLAGAFGHDDAPPPPSRQADRPEPEQRSRKARP